MIEIMNYLYIYKEPFTGSILNTMSNGFVHYTGESQTKKYTDEKGCLVHETSYLNPLNFEQYNEKHGGNLKVATEKEIEIIIDNFNNSLIDDFKEITEEKFYDLLECLPPKRWHTHEKVEIFFICEAYTADLHTCCVSYKGKHFSALRSIREESQSIATAVIKSFENLNELLD